MQTLKITDNQFDTLTETLDYMASAGGGYVEWYDQDDDLKLIYAESDFEEMLNLDK